MALPEGKKSGTNVTGIGTARRRRRPAAPVAPIEANQRAAGSPAGSRTSDPARLGKDERRADSGAKEPPRPGNRRFDQVKVDRVKAEIASGRYQIDYLQVADKFIEHERYA